MNNVAGIHLAVGRSNIDFTQPREVMMESSAHSTNVKTYWQATHPSLELHFLVLAMMDGNHP